MPLVRTFLACATVFSVAEGTNDGARAPPVQGSVGDAPVTSVSIGSSHTVLRADVLREYGHYAQGEPFDIIYYPELGEAQHLQAYDLKQTHSYDEAQTEAFNLIGHMIEEYPHIKHHVVCPTCPNSDCPGVICRFIGNRDAPEVAKKELAENEEGAGLLAPSRKLQNYFYKDEDSYLDEDEDGFTLGAKSAKYGQGCFSLESTVVVKGKGATPIKNLQLGDMILSDDQGTYTKFYSRGHYLEKAPSQFLRIFTEVTEKPLEATPNHLIFMAARALPVPASAINVGEVVRTIDGPAKVTAVEKITREGIYSPRTLSSSIIVDGVVASTNVVVQGFEGSRPGWVYLGGLKVVHWHQLVHAAYAPHRLVCGRLVACAEPLDDLGRTPFERFLLGLAQKATEKQSVLYSFLVLLAVALAVAPFYAIELLFENVFVVLVGGCAAAGMWRILSDVKVKVKSE